MHKSTFHFDNRLSHIEKVSIFTVHNEVAKVMFLHLSVILFTGGSASVHAGIPPPQSRHPPGSRHPQGTDTPQGADPPGADTPQDQTATVADCMHPTGMHSWLYYVYVLHSMFSTES